MILDEVEFLFSIDICDFSSNMEISQNFINFIELFFDVCKERSGIKLTTDWSVPIPAMFFENLLISIEDKFVIVFALGDK